MDIREELLYSKDHIWVKEENGKAVVGITAFALSELGDIVFVELPKEGERLTANDSFGSVESVKTVTELYAPVSGTVLQVNSALEERPSLVNESTYDDAWLIIMDIENEEEMKGLLTANEYKEVTEI